MVHEQVEGGTRPYPSMAKIPDLREVFGPRWAHPKLIYSAQSVTYAGPKPYTQLCYQPSWQEVLAPAPFVYPQWPTVEIQTVSRNISVVRLYFSCGEGWHVACLGRQPSCRFISLQHLSVS